MNDLKIKNLHFYSVLVLGLYEMYVVKQFYNDEIRHLVASCCNLDVWRIHNFKMIKQHCHL